MLHRLIYVSRAPARLWARAPAILAKIEKSAQRNNAGLGVTSALIYADGVYVQALEGPRPAVSATFQAILNDDRHARVELVAAASVGERWFPARPFLICRPGPEDGALIAQYCPHGRLDAPEISADAYHALLIYFAGRAERPALAAAC
jgi:hypothetical protein